MAGFERSPVGSFDAARRSILLFQLLRHDDRLIGCDVRENALGAVRPEYSHIDLIVIAESDLQG